MPSTNCSALRTMLARQTPVYDEIFLKDYRPMDSAVMGRHKTSVWETGTGDVHFYDKIEIGQPNLTTPWQQITSGECQSSCDPPRTAVSWGTTRNSYYMEQKRLVGPLMCLNQLRYSTKPGEQIAQIYTAIKKIPEMYTSDYLRVNAFARNTTVQIAGKDFNTFTPDISSDSGAPQNVSPGLTTINLGSASLLPTSTLTFNYLDYLATQLAMNGYSAESNLPEGMFNLITDMRTWFLMTNGSPSTKEMMAIDDPQKASPLYKIGQGVQKPYGNYVPTLDPTQIRFQVLSGGILQRVFPYLNTSADTGLRRINNPAYINARYGLSFLWHPTAINLKTPSFKRIHEKIPTINTSLFGSWQLINNQGLLRYTYPDGTVCDKDNTEQLWFYWLVAMELGFKFDYPEWIFPILHLLDGSGKDSTVDSPVCGAAPQYQSQRYDDNPDICQV